MVPWVIMRATVISLVPALLLPGCFNPDERRGTGLGTFGSEGGSAPTTTAGSVGSTDGATEGGTDTDASTASASASSADSEGSDTQPTAEGSSSSDPDSGEASSAGGASCGNGEVDEGEDCDDANADDTDDCLATCVAASCGDGFVQSGVEDCDDANADDTDDCLAGCVAASCGDGVTRVGAEDCDDANANDNDACLSSCTAASCGDGFVYEGVEQCDGTPGCSASCIALCGNPGGGDLQAENGTGLGVMYCYDGADSVETRASKACESHFGVGSCCLIPNGYSGLQYGQCGADGGDGTIHWHPDAHPEGHCDPLYTVGDVVSPGWCGVILGNFLD